MISTLRKLSLRVCVSCSISVVAYLGGRENASKLNILWGRWARMLGESLGMLHMNFVSFPSFLDV